LKYWRGYLVAAIIGLITWGLLQLGQRFTKLVDMVYPYLSRTIQSFLSGWSGGVDFLVWQLAVVLIILLVLATIVLMIIFRWNFFQWLGWILAGASMIWFLHTGIYGLNYHAGPLADDIRLVMSDYSLDELEEATIYYQERANALAAELPRDGAGNPIFSDFDTLAQQAGDGFKVLTSEKYTYSIFAGDLSPVKKLGWADMYTSMGITGVTMPITGEAAVNPQIPAVSLPFTMCHEMAHRMCIAIEADANFAAYLACSENESVEFRYSAYFMAYRYCYSALASLSSKSAATATARIGTAENEYLRQDMAEYNRFFNENMKDSNTKIGDWLNDTYIKVSGDGDGIRSYGRVSDLLVCWHLQTVVLPDQKDEAQSNFDPYDEDQVDLSGIVGALPKQTAGVAG
jgi:hypothetical protein